jgi:hypothetical protein
LQDTPRHCAVFDGLCRALRPERQHCVASITEQGYASSGPMFHRWMLKESPDKCLVDRLDNRADLRVPSFECIQYVGDVRRLGGSRLMGTNLVCRPGQLLISYLSSTLWSHLYQKP